MNHLSNDRNPDNEHLSSSVRPATRHSGAKHASHAAASSSGFVAADEGIRRVRKKKKQHKGLKIALGVLGALIVVIAGAAIALLLWANSLSSSMAVNAEDKEALDKVLLKTSDNEPFYILLLGSDAREGDTASRSDTMILTRVDPATYTVTMVSIPRDTKVEIEGHGTQKINAAYAFDGAAGAVEAVSDLAGVEISHYAEIHFEELETLIDELDGVWVDVPVSNNQTGSSNTGKSISAGEQLLDGETALAFARERYGYTRGDFQRAENQRILVTAILKQVLAETPTEMPGTIQQLAKCVTTDYSIVDLVTLAQKFQSHTVTFYSCGVPSTTKTIDGVSYVLTTEPDWSEMMELVDAGEDPNQDSSSDEDSDQ